MLFCGIDVAKRKHVALIMDDTGQVLGSAFSIENNRSGFDHILAQLRALSVQHSGRCRRAFPGAGRL